MKKYFFVLFFIATSFPALASYMESTSTPFNLPEIFSSRAECKKRMDDIYEKAAERAKNITLYPTCRRTEKNTYLISLMYDQVESTYLFFKKMTIPFENLEDCKHATNTWENDLIKSFPLSFGAATPVIAGCETQSKLSYSYDTIANLHIPDNWEESFKDEAECSVALEAKSKELVEGKFHIYHKKCHRDGAKFRAWITYLKYW